MQLDKYISEHYGSDDDDLKEVQLMQTLIIAHNFLTKDGSGDLIHKLHLSKLATPLLELLSNVDSILVQENPLTLRYFYYAVHDLQLIHFLILLGYFELGEGVKWSHTSL